MHFPRYRDVPMGRFDHADDLGATLAPTDHPDWLCYTPRAAPLTFTRANGEVITPDTFITDLGTVPPLLRIGRLLQPDSYTAVALIHDWVVRRNNCGAAERDFRDSILVQQEALKTWMETHPRDRSRVVFTLTRWGLRTRRSERGWCYQFDHCPPSLDAILAARRSL
ncbi:MAG: DUF1353 domain-containing protein [Pseudomonadota bacterium]